MSAAISQSMEATTRLPPFVEDTDDEDELSKDMPSDLAPRRTTKTKFLGLAMLPSTPDLAASKPENGRLARSASPVRHRSSIRLVDGEFEQHSAFGPRARSHSPASAPLEPSNNGNIDGNGSTKQSTLGRSTLNTKRKASLTSLETDDSKKSKLVSSEVSANRASQLPGPAPIAMMTLQQATTTQPSLLSPTEVNAISSPISTNSTWISTTSSSTLSTMTGADARCDSAAVLMHMEAENPLFVPLIGPTTEADTATAEPAVPTEQDMLSELFIELRQTPSQADASSLHNAHDNNVVGSFTLKSFVACVLAYSYGPNIADLQNRVTGLETACARIKSEEDATTSRQKLREVIQAKFDAEKKALRKEVESLGKKRNNKASDAMAALESTTSRVEAMHEIVTANDIMVTALTKSQDDLCAKVEKMRFEGEDVVERLNEFDDEFVARNKEIRDERRSLETRIDKLEKGSMRDEDTTARVACLETEVKDLRGENEKLKVQIMENEKLKVLATEMGGRLEKMEKFARSFPSF